MRLYWDIEATDLLNSNSVDYTQSPYQLKESFAVHCAVFIDVDTLQEYEFVGHEELLKVKQFLLDNCTELIAHNSISYDHMVMMAKYGLDFEICVNEGEAGQFYSLKTDSLCGIPVTITDTLVMSKLLNPTRTAHSVEYFGKILGFEKIDWRARAIELGLIEHNAPSGAEFKQYHPEMLVYCKRDCHVGIKIWKFLLKEWGDWKWDNAYQLEKSVAEIITHQEHRGFYFHKEKAVELIRDLDEKMKALRQVVEPLIPPKPIGKTAAKEFIPPKNQFKKDGTPSVNIIKWIEKYGGKIECTDGVYHTALFDNKDYVLPIPQEPIVTHVPASIEDTTHIKGWLVGLGWSPSQYKERDLTVDSRKQKLSLEKYVEACERYIEQTMSSPFKQDRMEHLEVRTEKALRDKLLKHDHIKRPLKVYTNPTLTVGVEKEIDPKLLEMEDKFAHAKDVSNYLTYRHRRNSILGGGIDPDDDEEEMEKGWMSVDRINQDHRIPTPADTCGAASSRFKHRLVANIPRVTSLYGEELRSLFGVDVSAGFVQVGYDFDGLEARIEGHYTWKYDDDEHSYCNSLLGEKPNDVHTLTAKKISAIIGELFGRTPAKTVKYACVPMHTRALTKQGWKKYDEINVGDLVLGYDAVSKTKKWTRVLDKVAYEDEVIEFGHAWAKFEATPDHRWFVKQRREFSTGKPNFSVRRAVDEVRTTAQLNSESNIIMNAPMDPSEDTTSNAQLSVGDKKYGFDWVTHVLNMSQQERKRFLEGFMVADGYYGNNVWQWSQNDGDIQEAAIIASYLVHDCALSIRTVNNTVSPMKNVVLSSKAHRTLQTSKKKAKGVQKVWCLTTELGSWVMRQGDVITITGNCSYGARPARVAKTVGCSLELGEKIFHAYWEAAQPLGKLMENVKIYWETKGGKKFILGLDGRKVPTRSASALINFLFQSAGVISAKRAMVIHDRKLKKEGMKVNFWKDDWKNKEFCQQLIAYHDESQLETLKKLVTWKMFSTEEEAKAFKKAQTDKVWSDVGHSPKGYYVGYCRAGELAVESVREAGQYYNLNVELTAGYMLGTTWASCH